MMCQRSSGLGSNARHTGYIIRGVAHQRLDIDKLLRRDAVFLKEACTVKNDGFLVGSIGTSVIRLAPPLIITKAEAGKFISALSKILKNSKGL